MVGLLNEKEAAKYLGVSVGMMRKWRLFRQGPAYLKMGRLVRYTPADLTKFVEASAVK
jgi:hypothetical protein